MGDSEKLAASGPGSYRLAEHRHYLDALLRQLGVTDRVVLVGHDWAREIPIDGTPADVDDLVRRNAAWMATAGVPKLLINGDPGALLTAELREVCRRWPHQREVTVSGLHFLPEDSPHAIADSLNEWVSALP